MGCRGIIVNLEGQNIHYEKYGTGKHHIFLMPGALGSTRTDFSHQLDNFDREKFTVVAWDPPGYGYSRPHDRQITIDFFQQDAKMARKLLNHLNINKTSVIGWSDGGMTALILTSQNPDLVEKLVVFGSVSYFTQQDLLYYEAVRDINKWDETLRKVKLDLYGEEYTKWMWNTGMSIRTNIVNERNGEICRNDLKLIKCPTLILHGKNDLVVPRSHPIFIKDNIPNSKFVEWADASHNLHIQFAHRFNYVVETFILS